MVEQRPTAESLLREVLENDAGEAVLRVASASMRPRLEAGDRIVIRRRSPRSLRPGDIIVFESETAGLVVHRLIWRDNPLGRPTRLYTKGDALDRLDRAVPIDRLLGRVERITRGGESLSPTTPLDRLRCLLRAAGHGLRRGMRWRPAPMSSGPHGQVDR